MDEEQTLAEALEAEFDKQASEGTEVETTEEETEVVETQTDTETVVDDETAVEDTQEPEVEAPEVSPPEHWSDEAKSVFMEMDERGREFALSQEKNFSKGIEEKSNELKKFRDAFEPYKHLVPPGVSEEQVIQQLLNAQATLQRNPVEGIKWLMQSYGVDEKQFAPTEKSTATADDLYLTPEQQEINALRETVETLTSNQEQKIREAEDNRQRIMLSQIASFRDETDDDGNLLHPHFNKVSTNMGYLMSDGTAVDMEDAYKQSLWMLPEYRESEVEQKAREFAEKQLAEKKKAAEKATKASKTVTGKKSAKTAPKEKTVADSLSENYEKSIRGEL